ncbi:MAG: hypothetical protein A3C36_06715 [Omnitrophica WOR_2 bacterium RIFCSPHIGHO2_02_FULL_52_10]|nr:MAG: hypothetical protein A3C36_06715 [Omnitrophica WOR_2 bacterium RIFCSPHIGHO2_02_FULL_52_10]
MLEDRIQKDYIAAMKSRDSLRSSTLSFLRAQIKNVLIEKKQDKLGDPDIITVIKKQVKQRQESVAQYEQGGRKDLADKEAAEMAVLKEYLPQEMSEQELKGLVAESIKAAQAVSMKDMGKVMKVMTEKVQGRADNKLVSELVKKALAQL